MVPTSEAIIMTSNKLSAAFTQNRTEELSLDVWNDFVAPQFLPDLDLLSATKPRIVVGGRGCGKTMLLRYYSFESQFSKRRQNVPPEAFKDIGLYWRIDTQFAKVMYSRGVADTEWIIAFEHFLVVYLAIEMLRALDAISQANGGDQYRRQIDKLTFNSLNAYGPLYVGCAAALKEALQKDLKAFELWVSNVKKVQEPIFLPKAFLDNLIEVIRSGCDELRELSFHVFVDEFENLLPYQQEVVNTRIKHSQKPLVFSIAMKRRGFTTQKTVGEESITEINDYRLVDLEDELLESDFDLFAAEILLLNLWKAGFKNLPIHVESLRDISCLNERKDKDYRSNILTFVKTIFPSLSELDLAESILKEPSLRNALRKKIERALKERFGTSEGADELIDDDLPKESIICPALVYRRGLNPRMIKEELQRSKLGQPSKFDNWVHNNFIGCVLQIYEPYQKVCPFYAGFSTFIQLAKGNLRHLLELCSKSIGSGLEISGDELRPISVEIQAKAARQASAAFLQEVRSFGTHGNRLHAFVLRLGSLFALSQGRNGQIQPEVNHFSITGKSQLTEEHNKFLGEAVKWTVLFEDQETKVSRVRDGKQANLEYVLNPIYAPYFNISYRKRRRIELPIEEFQCLFEGDYTSVSELLKKYSKKWKVDLEESNPTLFTHLID